MVRATGLGNRRLDPDRNAVLQVAGDKSGAWSEWYEENIPVAKGRYENWLAGEYA